MSYAGFVLRMSGDLSTALMERPIPLKFVSDLGGSWEQHRFQCRWPLRGEEAVSPTGYDYSIFLRKSGTGERIVVVAESLRIVRGFLRYGIPHLHGTKLTHVRIAVGRLVTKIIADPGDYALSYIHVRTPGLEDDLSSISFYGLNVTRVPLYRQHTELFQPYGCGVRDSVNFNEIVRLRSDGMVSFVSLNRVRAVNRVLHFVSEHGFFE